jgi:hypothetical protein
VATKRKETKVSGRKALYNTGADNLTVPRQQGGSDTALLPAWAERLLTALRDGQEADAAAIWARQVEAALQRIGKPVPFSVVHDWHAQVVFPLLAESSTSRGADPAPHVRIARLHADAATGRQTGEERWAASLEPALRDLYYNAYAFAGAFDTAKANARAYALANGYEEAEADRYGHDYAQLSTEANAQAFASANALANAKAAAAAYAADDGEAYAGTFPEALLAVYVAAATGNEPGTPSEAFARLANGLLASVRAIQGVHPDKEPDDD